MKPVRKTNRSSRSRSNQAARLSKTSKNKSSNASKLSPRYKIPAQKVQKRKENNVEKTCDSNEQTEDHDQYHDSRYFLKCLYLQPVDSLEISMEGSKLESPPRLKSTSSNHAVDDTSSMVNDVIVNVEKVKNENEEEHGRVSAEGFEDSPIKNIERDFWEQKIESDQYHGKAKTENQDKLSLQMNKPAKKKSFIFSDENYLNKDKYIFRDGNTKPALHFHDTEEPFPSFSMASVNRKKYGPKRRFDKLIKSLKDGEQRLNNNLKESQLLDQSKSNEEKMGQLSEKLKENLRVREKKKYESLINYQRDQSQAHIKAFQELLPDKMGEVEANVKKQLKTVKSQRCRGRRKENGDENKPRAKRSKRGNKKEEKVASRKQKSSITENPCWKKSTRVESECKLGNFRIEIVNRNGADRIIELNGEELKRMQSLKQVHKVDSADKENNVRSKAKSKMKMPCSANTADDKEICAAKAKRSALQEQPSNGNCMSQQEHCTSKGVPNKDSRKRAQKNDKKSTHPATFALPPVTSLETDYELVSLSPSNSPRRGNFKTDQFIIPQYTFNKKGKTGMIMIGPFRLVSEPHPHLVLVPPGGPQKSGTTMMLQRKVHSPSNTPPRDFRIRKDSRQGGAPCRPAQTQVVGNDQVTLLDHSYMTPPDQWDRVRRYSKAVAKHSANADFIDARVENIEPVKDNVLVTIRGDNMLRMVNQLSDPAQAPMRTSKDGMPVIYTLSQIMTPALQMATDKKKRDKLAQISFKTTACTSERIPLSSMGDVVIEVVIPPGGTEVSPSKRNQMKSSSEEMERFIDKALDSSFKAQSILSNSGSSENINFLHTNIPIQIEDSERNAGVEESTETRLSHLESSGDQQEALPSDGNIHVPVENEASVNTHAARCPGSGLPCCRLCLRLFPSEPALLGHMCANHQLATDQTQALAELPHVEGSQGSVLLLSGDLNELRDKSILMCPVCPPSDPPLLLTKAEQLSHHIQHCHSDCYTSDQTSAAPYSKVQQRQHLHSDPVHFPASSATACQNYHCQEEHMCQLCPARFADARQLEVHLQISHKSSSQTQRYHRGGMVSLIKPPADFSNETQHSLLANCLLCSKCNTAHRDRSSLLCHTLKVHPELNQFNVCRLCDRLFDNNVGLHRHLKKAHRLSHSGTLKCPFCPAWLPSMEMASIHRVTLHTGALPVHCPFCGAGFQGMHGMYNHVRVHHLQTEHHVCPECQASFTSARALSEHARKIHGMAAQALRESLHSSNSTTYCCPFCSMALARTYELAMHLINAHADHLLPRRCHLCLQAFVSNPVLKIHLAGAHGLEVAEESLDSVEGAEEEVDEEEMEDDEDEEVVGRRFLQQQQQQQHQNQQHCILQQQNQKQHIHQQGQQQQQNQQHCIFQQGQQQQSLSHCIYQREQSQQQNPQQHHIFQQQQEPQRHLLKQQQQEHYLLQQQQNEQHHLLQQQEQQQQQSQQCLLQQQQQKQHHLLQQQHQDNGQFQVFERAQEDQDGDDQGRREGGEKYSHQPHDYDEQDILETQEAGRFLEELQEQETNAIACLNESSQVLTIPMEQHAASGQMFPGCSSLEDEVQLLGPHTDHFNLSGVDYLETLNNDSIAVGADVVAAAGAGSKAQIISGQDPLELSYQLEIDGVLYQLASSMDVPQGEPMDTTSAINAGLAHLLQQ